MLKNPIDLRKDVNHTREEELFFGDTVTAARISRWVNGSSFVARTTSVKRFSMEGATL